MSTSSDPSIRIDLENQLMNLFRYSQFDFITMSETVAQLGSVAAFEVLSSFVDQNFTIQMFSSKRDIKRLVSMMAKFHFNAKRVSMVYSQFAPVKGKNLIENDDSFFIVMDTIFERILNSYFHLFPDFNLVKSRKIDLELIYSIISYVPGKYYVSYQKPFASFNPTQISRIPNDYKLLLDQIKRRINGRIVLMPYKSCLKFKCFKIIRGENRFEFMFKKTWISLDVWVNAIESGLLHLIGRMHLRHIFDYTKLSTFLMKYFKNYSQCENRGIKKNIAKEIRSYLNSPCSVSDRRELCAMQELARRKIEYLIRTAVSIRYDAVRKYYVFVGQQEIIRIVVGINNMFVTAF